MRAAFYDRLGAARQVLQVGDLPTPEPGPGEVRVRLHASGVNPSDVKSRMGRPGVPTPAAPVVPHSDGAGVIDAVGAGVPPSRVGERVWIWNARWGRDRGTAAEFVALPSAQARPLPAEIDFAAGACLGIPALTAWRAVTLGGPVEGRMVLVAGGAGAVGHYAVQMAKRLGATVIATVSSPAKAEHARRGGADHVVNYRDEDVVTRAKEITGGAGVDRIVEVDLKTNGPAYARYLKPHGQVVVYGSSAWDLQLPFAEYLFHGVDLSFFVVYNLPPAVRAEANDALDAMLKAGALQHTIGRRFRLDQVVEAHEAVEAGTVMGNVVLEI